MTDPIAGKTFWKQYSGVELENGYTIYIDTGDEGWGVFKADKFLADSHELINHKGELQQHSMGLMETLLSVQVPWKIAAQLVESYLAYLFEENEEQETKQSFAAKTEKNSSSPEDERYWAALPDARELHPSSKWDEKPCTCGSPKWCGRDAHRPHYAVNPESNSTIFFEE